jgi:predicted dehydrogenase
MRRYTTVLVGCGPRGGMQAQAVQANPAHFELVAVCDRDAPRLRTLAAQCGAAHTYTDAEAMLAAERPEVLCFATPPAVRLPLVELGVTYGVKAVALEKPLALSLAEAKAILDLCTAAQVKLIVCHQWKYHTHWQQVWELVQSGMIGDIQLIHATSRPSMLRVGTHLVDTMLWLNGGHRGAWVIGQVHGTTTYQEDHPCPDYVMGVIQFANGVRGLLECGTLAPQRLTDDDFWSDSTVVVYGTRGAVTCAGDGWRVVSTASGETIRAGPCDPTPQEPRWLHDLAVWLDHPAQGHPCHGGIAYHGFELLMGLALSSLERRQIVMPIQPLPSEPELARLAHLLPELA